VSLTSDKNRQEFLTSGFTILPGFYCQHQQVEPILEGIRDIIALICHKYDVAAPTDTPAEAMTTAFMALIQQSRGYGAEVYDAVKQIPAFMQLVSDCRNADVFKELRAGSMPGLAAGSYGIRIDCPGERTFRAPWHQEFPAQLRSLDGVVFWTPLVSMRPSLGPVELCVGSHLDGLASVYSAADSGQQGAYALRIVDEEEVVKRYEHRAPLTQPGDLLLLDFLTLHQSGDNVDVHPRWSIQFRYFNFHDPLGLRISWRGSFASGNDFRAILSEVGIKA
jgi:ectoine hydroxylase-related dioxygenase (phytanoyl-CoA dioxygenase family)